MNIREVKRFDSKVFQAVLNLLPQLASYCTLPTEQHFKNILKSDSSHFFIVELDNSQVVGILTLGTYIIPSGMRVWIEDVVVDDKMRGKGYGKELILAAIKYAKSLGASTIELTSRPSRVAANQLYQQIGFVQQDTNKYTFHLD